MSKSNALETAILGLLFNATAISNIADDAASGALTELYVSLHTSDPGEGGDQTTNEISYTGYARVAVDRDNTGWTVSGNSVSPVSDVVFGEMSGGSGGTVTHFGIGTASSGSGVLLYSGTVTPNISVTSSPAVTPKIKSTSTITED